MFFHVLMNETGSLSSFCSSVFPKEGIFGLIIDLSGSEWNLICCFDWWLLENS